MSIKVIGDPHHEIRDQLSDRGWLDVFFNTDYGHLREREWADHPKGYFQPAVIAVGRDESGIAQILYRWRCVPKYSNMSGAGGRPEARYTWDAIQSRLDTNNPTDAPLDLSPQMGAGDLSWFQFLVILLAHGWFVRPRAFPLLRDGDKDRLSPTGARRRWWVFGGIWALSLLIFPGAWVATAFLLWLVALIPGLIEIHRQFQNEPDPH